MNVSYVYRNATLLNKKSNIFKMKVILNYQQIAPKAEQLKKLIKLYYIQQSDAPTTTKTTYFPNYTTTLNIYQQSKVTWGELSRIHEHDATQPFLKLLVGKFDKSREIITKGRFNKLTIVFNPLGISHFLKAPLSHYATNHFSFFNGFGESFDELLPQVFDAPAIEEKRDFLDAYFLKKYIGFKEDRLTFAVKSILETDGDTTIQELAKMLNISRKTILRLFKAHLLFTPSAYKSVVKFRKALNSYQLKNKQQNFSSLAYTSNYYDQSDLNFHFKAKTGLTPQQLFKSIQQIEQDLYWKMVDVPKVQDIQ